MWFSWNFQNIVKDSAIMKRRERFFEGNQLDHSTGELALKRYAALTPSERGLLRHLAELLRNGDIDGYQSIIDTTSQKRIQQIEQKLGVASIEEAVAYAEQHNIFRRWRQTRFW
jgi:DNA-binding CsgD family transcriptional regulator